MKLLYLNKISAIVAFTLIYPLNILSADKSSKIIINNNFYMQYNDISGPGKDNSSLIDGLRYLNIFNLYKKGYIKDYRYSVNLGLKATDNRRKDPKDISITNFQISLKNKINTFKAGDVFQSFSQYSLTNALKGVSYRYLDSKRKNQIQLIYGIAYPRWDSFWDSDTKATKRTVYGARYQKTSTNRLLRTGISFVYSKDTERLYSGIPLYKNYLYTLDVNYFPIPGLWIYGEFSHSQNNRNDSDDTPNKDFSGNAFKLRATGDKNPSKVVLEFERVATDFITLTGSATPDREKFKATWRYRINKTVTSHFGFLWYKNNLNHQLDTTTNVYRPSIHIVMRKVFGRKYNNIDLSYKLDRVTNENSTTNHIFGIGYSDRYGKVYNTTNIAYNKYKTTNSIQDSHEIRANTQFSGRIRKNGYVFKPSLSLGTWSNKDELQNTLDKFYEASIGMGVEVPKHRLTAKFKIGKNKAIREEADDSTKTFANLFIYYKPKKLYAFKRSLLYAKILYNDYSFSTDDNNFRESSIRVGINIRF